MSFLLRDLLRHPATLEIVAASVLFLVVVRTRFAKWAVVASPVLVWLCTAPGQFDGQRHLTAKFDATGLVWTSCVELRALGALALLLLAAPVGAAAGRLVGARRGALWGLAALSPFTGSLLASSALLLPTMAKIVADSDLAVEAKLALLRAAIASSDQVVAAGTVLSLLVCTSLGIGLARAPATPAR